MAGSCQKSSIISLLIQSSLMPTCIILPVAALDKVTSPRVTDRGDGSAQCKVVAVLILVKLTMENVSVPEDLAMTCCHKEGNGGHLVRMHPVVVTDTI